MICIRRNTLYLTLYNGFTVSLTYRELFLLVISLQCVGRPSEVSSKVNEKVSGRTIMFQFDTDIVFSFILETIASDVDHCAMLVICFDLSLVHILSFFYFC